MNSEELYYKNRTEIRKYVATEEMLINRLEEIKNFDSVFAIPDGLVRALKLIPDNTIRDICDKIIKIINSKELKELLITVEDKVIDISGAYRDYDDFLNSIFTVEVCLRAYKIKELDIADLIYGSLYYIKDYKNIGLEFGKLYEKHEATIIGVEYLSLLNKIKDNKDNKEKVLLLTIRTIFNIEVNYDEINYIKYLVDSYYSKGLLELKEHGESLTKKVDVGYKEFELTITPNTIKCNNKIIADKFFKDLLIESNYDYTLLSVILVNNNLVSYGDIIEDIIF